MLLTHNVSVKVERKWKYSSHVQVPRNCTSTSVNVQYLEHVSARFSQLSKGLSPLLLLFQYLSIQQNKTNKKKETRLTACNRGYHS